MILFNPLIFRRKKRKRYSSPHPAMPTKIYNDPELNGKIPKLTTKTLIVFVLLSFVGFAGLVGLFFRVY